MKDNKGSWKYMVRKLKEEIKERLKDNLIDREDVEKLYTLNDYILVGTRTSGTEEDKEDDKYETHIIYVILQGQDFETWIWKFIVHEYDMDGMAATHVSGYLSDYYGTRDETGWVLLWALGDDVNSDEWYNQHLRQEFGDGEIYEFEDVDNELEEDQSIVVVELRGINGGGYKTVSTKGLKFDYKVK